MGVLFDPHIKRPEPLSYGKILAEHHISYVEKEMWLEVYEPSFRNGMWILSVSIVLKQTAALLDIILPVAVKHHTPLKVVKNDTLHHYINVGAFGAEKVGQNMLLFPNSPESTVALIEELAILTNTFEGPMVNNMLRITSALYAGYCIVEAGKKNKFSRRFIVPATSLILPALKQFEYPKSTSIRWLKKRYYCLSIIRRSCKGNIYKAIHFSLRNPGFCIIKEGIRNMVDDKQGRDIRDRLKWQYEVHNDLTGKIRLPEVTDLFKKNDNCYLVMKRIKGKPLSDRVTSWYQRENWLSLHKRVKMQILSYYFNLLLLVEQLHQQQYIHRDIKDGNLLWLESGQPYLLDYELCYSVKKRMPNPAFKSFAPGYQSPEQFFNPQPQYTEDIYALGSLLSYLLTGISPKKQIESSVDIEHLIQNHDLYALIIECLDEQPHHRPTLSKIKTTIKRTMDNITHDQHVNPSFCYDE